MAAIRLIMSLLTSALRRVRFARRLQRVVGQAMPCHEHLAAYPKTTAKKITTSATTAHPSHPRAVSKRPFRLSMSTSKMIGHKSAWWYRAALGDGLIHAPVPSPFPVGLQAICRI
jgi:hypothetical protein